MVFALQAIGKCCNESERFDLRRWTRRAMNNFGRVVLKAFFGRLT
jgi:hypothetical protein